MSNLGQLNASTAFFTEACEVLSEKREEEELRIFLQLTRNSDTNFAVSIPHNFINLEISFFSLISPLLNDHPEDKINTGKSPTVL